MNEEHSLMALDALSHSALHCWSAVAEHLTEPSAVYRPKLFPDGNQWCALYGENIQEGVCGFGETPMKAMNDFNRNWYGQKLCQIEVTK